VKVQPYTFAISQEEIDALRVRVQQTNWPIALEGAGWERSVPVPYLKNLADYWINKYDWRKAEAEINQYDQFIATVDDQPIHFFHIRSEQEGALPLLLLHGWPSSSVEYLKMIELLVHPQQGEQAFHLVIPTLPGFGLSAPVQKTGWQSPRTAQTYADLMEQLGYEQYGAHGTDIGADIVGELGKAVGEKLIGAHYGSSTVTIVLSVGLFMGGGDPAQSQYFSEEQRERVKQIQGDAQKLMSYFTIQSNTPQTIGYSFNDSPVSLLATLTEQYKAGTKPTSEVPEKKIDIDQMLTNISIYWFMGSGTSAAQYIYENMHTDRDWSKQSMAPVGYAIFNAEPIARPLLDPEHHIAHWSEFKEGEHFPAMEAPQLLAKDLQKFFSSL